MDYFSRLFLSLYMQTYLTTLGDKLCDSAYAGITAKRRSALT